jgi:hypothetical protein
MDLFRAVRVKHPSKVWWADESKTRSMPILAENLNNYAKEGYDSMSLDANRNGRYSMAINEAVTAGARNWIEVGPGECSLRVFSFVSYSILVVGKDAVLTRMVLEAHDNTHIFAIEGNDKAVKPAEMQLRTRGYKTRSWVFSGLSNEAKAIGAAKDWESAKGCVCCSYLLNATDCLTGKYHALVQEVLGFIASSEGVAALVGNLKRDLQVSKSFKTVPVRAATLWCPVFLNKQVSLCGIYHLFVLSCQMMVFVVGSKPCK